MNIPMIACSKDNYRAGRDGKQIQYIVVHYTANNADTARGNAQYFSRTCVQASAHFFVDETEVIQSVAENDTAWHCGATQYRHPQCRNGNALGVELCSRKDAAGKYYFKPETMENAARVVRELMKKYQVPPTHVIRHFDVTGKNCPAPFVENAAAWTAFMARLAAPAAQPTSPLPQPTPRPTAQPTAPATAGKENDDMIIYETLKDVPVWALPTVEKLIAKKLLQGESAALNLEHNSLRVLVINDRAGLYH